MVFSKKNKEVPSSRQGMKKMLVSYAEKCKREQ